MIVKQILIVDDDSDDIEFMKEAILSYSSNVAITCVNSGMELMSKLESGFVPDVLILDLIMPKKDGRWCLKEIQTNVTSNNFIIIIYTTSNLASIEQECLQLGANFFISKPATMPEIKKVAEQICMATFKFQ